MVKPSPISVTFGVIQTAFYIDFAWVYWTRQRVKLRNGGVVDSEELSRGYLISKFLGRGASEVDEEDTIPETGAAAGHISKHFGSHNGWGARGVSVSADSGVSEVLLSPESRLHPLETDEITRPDEEAGNLQIDEGEDSDDDIMDPNQNSTRSLKGGENGEEWRNEAAR